MYKFINKNIARRFKTPQYLILFVTDKCWMKCSHCWYNEKWKAEHLSKNNLSFDELNSISQSIEKINFLSITGGEAFLRDDIIEIVKLFAANTKLNRYQIPTSGFDTEKILNSAEMILQNVLKVPFRIDVSLDGIEETHDKIRNRPGSFKKALETIAGLREIKRRRNNFDLGIITTISNRNQHQVEEIASLIEKIYPEGEWMVNITRGNTRGENFGEVDIKNYIKAHELIEARIEAGNYNGHGGHALAKWLSAKNAVRRKLIVEIINGKQTGGGCSAGSLGGVIFNDGSVYPCEMLDESFGNVRDFEYDLQKLWNSENADRIRELIEDTKCICTQECFLSTNILIQPRQWPKIINERFKLLKNNPRIL